MGCIADVSALRSANTSWVALRYPLNTTLNLPIEYCCMYPEPTSFSANYVHFDNAGWVSCKGWADRINDQPCSFQTDKRLQYDACADAAGAGATRGAGADALGR